MSSGGEDAGSSYFLDSLLSNLREQLSLDNEWDLGKRTLAEDLEVALIVY